MSYSVNTTPSQNVQAAKEQHYTREQLKEDLKSRDAKSKPYTARPGETAWSSEKEQMHNQGMSTATKKRGIRGLFSRDHAKGAEKEARKEMFHAEKAERYAQRSRDPALNDRQRRKFLRKAAKQQASADFHESLKKKHVIGATPGHKYQAVPAMGTHHPIVHDNTTNTVRTTVNDQSFAPSRMPIGPAAFDGISEIGSRQAALEPHPAVLNVSNNIAPQQRWEGQVSADRKLSRKQPAYVPTGDKHKMNTPIVQQQPMIQQQIVQQPMIQQPIMQQSRDMQVEPVQQKQSLPFVASDLQATQLQPIMKERVALPFGADDLQEHKLQPIMKERVALPFGADDLQGTQLKPRYEQREALPFGAADLQGIKLTAQVGDIQKESLRPWNAVDLQQGASSLRPVQRDYLVGYPMIDEDDYSSDEDDEYDDDDIEESRDMQVEPMQQKQSLPFGASDLQGINLKSSKVQHETLPFGASELQQGAKGLNESQPWKSRKLPFSGAYLREGGRRLQHSSTVERNGMWLNAGHLASQSKKLNHVTPRVRDTFMVSGPALRNKREMLKRTKTVEKRAVTLPSVKAITAQRKNLKASTTRERSSYFIPSGAHLRSTRGKLNKVGTPTTTYVVVVDQDMQVPKNTKQARAINLSKMGQAKSQQQNQPSMLTTINNFVANLFSGNTAESQ